MSVPPPHSGPGANTRGPFDPPAAPPLRGPHPDAAYGPGSASYWSASQDDRSLSVLTHLGALLVSALVPLIMFLVKKDESPFVREQARQSLNLQITVLIAATVSGLLTVVIIGFILLPLVVIASWVLQIIATVKAYGGEVYRMPFTFEFVR